MLNPIMYKYNIADGNYLIQEVDIKEENSSSVCSSAETLQVHYNKIRIKKERITKWWFLTVGNSEKY